MAPIVETASGKVEGEEENGIRVFRGIPFGRPVSGPLRFTAPLPPEPWSGIRPAFRFGDAAPQARGMLSTLPGFAIGSFGEDCLNLNVWTPATDGAARPVMVWIPGGGFTMGSGSQEVYDGAALAGRGDLVVVTINYRLGALGFLYRGDAGEDNRGLLDQVAALAWVRDNIAAFGGDPGQVTVFGESAGAMSVSALLATPAARGLFRRAIAQSGAEHVMLPDQAHQVACSFYAALGLDPSSPSDMQRFADAPLADLIVAQEACATEYARGRKGLAWRPVVDGVTLPGSPCEQVANGASVEVPLLIGTNRDEWRLFGLGDPGSLTLDEPRLASRLQRTIGEGYETVLGAYRAARPSATPSDLWFALEGDRIFRVPAVRLADSHSRHGAGTFAYLFTWESPTRGLGSCHGLEIPFVFGNLDKSGMPVFAGSSPEAFALSEVVQDAWIAFARTGDPSHSSLDRWPPYDRDRRTTMLLGAPCEAVEAANDPEIRAWDALDGARSTPAP